MNRKQFGEFIKNQRMAQAMTQRELAEKAKLSRRQAVIEVEKDMCDYGVNVLVTILSSLGFELIVHPIAAVVQTSLNFSNVKSAQPQDDPNYLEEPKKKRKFVKQKSNKNEKSSR